MEKLSKEQISALPEWMPIEGFEGLYEVNCRAGIVRNSRTLRVLKQNPNSDGYPCVSAYKDGIGFKLKVHRIIAVTAFHYYGISTDGLLVMHLDEERHNPRIDNLALGTAKENGNFPKAKQRCSETKKGEKHPLYGKHLSEETRMKIAEVKKGKYLSVETRMKIAEAKPKKPVAAYKDGILIMAFTSVREASRKGYDRSGIVRSCRDGMKKYKNYNWKFIQQI